MSEEVTFTNVYCAYVKNMPHGYPGEQNELITVTDTNNRKSHTGWQIIPNMLWRHFCTPKQWYEFVINYQSYHVDGASCTVFNPVPITTSLAIQRVNTFAAFNNCTYCLGYEDDIYETYWHPWYAVREYEDINLFFKEGIYFTQSDGSTEVTEGMQRVILPPYYWKRINSYTVDDVRCWGQGKNGEGVWPYTDGSGSNPVPGGLEWDPLNRPDKIKELRAGKNAITFSWKCHEADSKKWFNVDRLVHWTPWTPAGPYCGGGRPLSKQIVSQNDPFNLSTYGLSKSHGNDTNPGWFWDYTLPNWANMPIVPMAWWWKEMQNSIIEEEWPGTPRPDFTAAGTEAEQYLYGPTQWFIKGIPLLGSDNRLIETHTMVALKISLHMHAKRRKSALFAPTWGPFSWLQLYSHTKGNMIFQEPTARYRTGGMRRTWQNREGAPGEKYFPREAPYASNQNYPPSNRPKAGPVAEEEEETQHDYEPTVTFSKAQESATIQVPKRPARRMPFFRTPSQSEPAEVTMMKDVQMG